MNLFDELLKDIRTVDVEGVTWFNFDDICKKLEISDPTNAYMNIDDQYNYCNVIDDMSYVTEGVIYDLASESNAPLAKKFMRWVTHDMVPSLIRTGAYTTKEKKCNERPSSSSNNRLEFCPLQR